MDIARIDLNLLVAFEVLIAERNVTRAARRLGLSQPAASDALRRLRLVFGDEILVRAGSSMQPTLKAQKLAPRIRAALTQLRDTLNDEVPFNPKDTTRRFTVAATDYCTFVIAPRLVATIRRDAPAVDLNVTGYEKTMVGDMLAGGAIDVALGVFSKPPPNAVRVPLVEENFVGVARRGHPALAKGKLLNALAFSRLLHALVSVREDRIGVLDEVLAAQGLRRRVVLTLPHMLALPAVLATTDLVSALPRRIAATLDPSLVQLFDLPLALSPWTVEMLWNPSTRSDKASVWLRSCIHEAALQA